MENKKLEGATYTAQPDFERLIKEINIRRMIALFFIGVVVGFTIGLII